MAYILQTSAAFSGNLLLGQFGFSTVFKHVELTKGESVSTLFVYDVVSSKPPRFSSFHPLRPLRSPLTLDFVTVQEH